MPTSLHPQAKFDPIPPDIDLHAAQIRNLGPQEFEKLVQIHVVAGGKPLVIDGWDTVLPKWLFNVDWLERTYDKKRENVRDISAAIDIPMTTGHYLRSMRQLANQWTPHTFRDDRRQRLYLKDIDCPLEWRDALQRFIHPALFYLNENVNVPGIGGQRQDDDDFRSEATAAPAGDLMSSLPETMRAENLMCYIGHEGTYTPAHREMCASLGQNIMVETSDDTGGDKAGSSIWFMTESKDREVVREYFLSMLGHDIEIEKHFAQINAWKKAPFDVYIVEQRAGDFILIPPLAAHQVWNRGTRTMKVAWNRTTVETLDLAMHEALPKARLVCRDEQYKNKAIVYFTLQNYFNELQQLEKNAEMTRMSLMGIGHEIIRNSTRVRQLAGDFKRLFALFTGILVDEAFAYKEKEVDYLPFDSCVTCSYCRSNIFNRFLTCKNCIRPLLNGEEDAYDVCMECYAMGRSCACLSGLQWCEQWSWPGLVERFETWRALVIANDGYIDMQASPQPFEVARLKSGKKSVAQICQEALRRRPWKDITKQEEQDKSPSDSEPGEGDDKVRKKPKRKKKKGEVRRCHVCCHKDYSYRVHECSNPGCTEAYCYGVLYRAFDLMPQRVLEDEYWQCPKCLGICSCGSCRRSGNTNAYTPKNTLLGHDTRPIADDRSVEALVDFRVHNLSWLKAVGEESRSKDSRRMQRLREQADNAKARDQTHQAEAQQAMQDDIGAVGSPAKIAAERPEVIGYGDQSEAIKHPSSTQGDEERVNTSLVDHESSLLPDAASPTDIAANMPDAHSYPDPSVFIRQRIGMGYYEQDDTPDKILFDPYQAPSADVVGLSEAGVSEYVKKSIRAAKRKARRENEDPDFVVGRSHHKRPRFVQPDMLESMDPALFDEPEVRDATRNQPIGNPDAQSHVPSAPLHGKTESFLSGRQPLPRFDANEPSLRHAKPLTSYVELEDAELEEFEEDDVGHRALSHIETHATTKTGDTIDQMALEDSAMQDCTAPSGGDAVPQPLGEAVTPITVRKRRGRPPKRQSAAAESPDHRLSTHAHSAASTGKAISKRGRGRPRKSTNSMTPLNGDGKTRVWSKIATEKVGIEDVPQARTTSKPAAPSKNGTRRRGVTTIAAAMADGNSFPFGESEPDPLSKPDNVLQEAAVSPDAPLKPKRGRGRPRRSDVPRIDGPMGEEDELASQTFMSLAERMALRGKSFKIGRRKLRTGHPGPTSDNVTSGEDGEDAVPVLNSRPSPNFDRRKSAIDRSPTPTVTAEVDRSSSEAASCAPAGNAVDNDTSSKREPTVVRLADVESDDERGWPEHREAEEALGGEGALEDG
ncbi:hypothetical protein XA68_18513 [Ophiocordyceps unilateralis]|uniref:JmjC domain-containing protein n=1 Tax=Ophiocordyceps unilateralis TaxID=268505 RepID=A0A2A9P2Z0_OPHUN|nr:hypothetical protein XA68_18513 [Ophiocordyceps unilateralis]